MFVCQSCRKVTEPRELSTAIVAETRKVYYENKLSNGETRRSNGWEIVRELRVCSDCAKASEPF